MQTIKTWAAGLAAAMMMTGAWAAELKFATVDLDRVFTAHPKTQAAEAELKKAEEAIEIDMERVVAEGRALEEEVVRLREQARSPMLSEEARQQRRAEAEDKITELQEFQLRARRTQETRLKQLRDSVMASRQGIVDELLELVADFAKAEGYDLIVDRSGMTMNMVPVAVFSSDRLDVTDQLIERLNSVAE